MTTARDLADALPILLPAAGGLWVLVVVSLLGDRSLRAPALHALLTQAADEAGAGRWSTAAGKQDQAGKELVKALERLEDFSGIEPILKEIHRLENEGDRLTRSALKDLFIREAAGLGSPSLLHPFDDVSQPGKLDPRAICRRIDELLPEARTVVADCNSASEFPVEHVRILEGGDLGRLLAHTDAASRPLFEFLAYTGLRSGRPWGCAGVMWTSRLPCSTSGSSFPGTARRST